MRASRHRLAAVLLTVSLALAGCGAADEGPGGGDERAAAGRPDAGYAADGPAAEGPAPDRPAPGAKAGPGATAAPRTGQQQHVIRTASLSVEVEDATDALATARAVTEATGGHVADETTERVDDDHVTSQIVLRVPQAAYDATLRELAGAGKLLSRKAQAKDVTDQVVDVESRIATQRASVARVRELMDEATKLSDVVALEGQLSSRQADLESLLAQRAALRDRTTMATITLRLSEREEPAGERDDGPGFRDALSGGWNALVTTGKWAGIVLLAVAPWAGVLLVGYAGWRWLVRRRPVRPGPAERPDAEGSSS
ncbi:DUF4349 domain-containing protein [Streptomyces lavendofoliae]|uniref:DUF4349 domain-containing protein n=1 Tax=Streptomyces lavendofoliae TaxID=67314 RepID=A0A918HUK4_9ACTN|nr:DUF4349 domain-containing protein [Streptomyces lavendofoliae]GGU25715.1 hypothetical protein GCM10010274_10460 [Streptomyces lavendofoliae]